MVAEVVNSFGKAMGWNETRPRTGSSGSLDARSSSGYLLPLTPRESNCMLDDGDPLCCCGLGVWERSLGNNIYRIQVELPAS